jgi:hypothetical protein
MAFFDNMNLGKTNENKKPQATLGANKIFIEKI